MSGTLHHSVAKNPSSPSVCSCGASEIHPELVWKCSKCQKDTKLASGLPEDVCNRTEERLNKLMLLCGDSIKNMGALIIRGATSGTTEGVVEPTIEEYKEAQKAAVEALTKAFGSFFEEDIAILRKNQEQERRRKERKHLVDELANTEKDYRDDMQTILDVWIPAVSEGKFFDSRQESMVFNMIKQISHLSNEFSTVFSSIADKPEDEQKLGEALLNRVPFLRLYVEQTSSFDKVTEIVNEALKNRRFQEMQRNLASNPRVKGLDLLGFLVMPMQRLARYPLLIQSILKCTDESHPDYPSLVLVLQELRKVVAEINDLSKLRMSLPVFSRLQHVMTWTSKSVDFVLSGAVHLCSEDASWELRKYKSEHTVVMKGNFILLTSLLVVLIEKGSDKNKLHEKKMFFPQELEILPEDRDSPNTLKILVRRIRKEYVEDKKPAVATRRLNRSCSVSSSQPLGAFLPEPELVSNKKTPKYVLCINCLDFLDMQSWIMRFKDFIDDALPRPSPLYPWNSKNRINGVRHTAGTKRLGASASLVTLDEAADRIRGQSVSVSSSLDLSSGDLAPENFDQSRQSLPLAPVAAVSPRLFFSSSRLTPRGPPS